MDAVQCGIFLETWYSRCDEQLRHEQVFGKPSDYEGEDTILNPDLEANQITEESVDFGGLVSTVLDDGLFVLPSTCPPGPTFSFMGYTFQLDYSPFCDFAEAVRPFVIALGYIIAALMMAGMISREGN
jgi:hypothetical protein